jgi:ribosomal protein S18 acetylase RimI-like enzyme
MRCSWASASGPSPPVPGLALEEAKPEDAAAILEIYHACGFAERGVEDMQRVLGDGRHTHAVARLDGRVAAFAEIETHWAERIWVSFVGVENALRAKGVGSALVAWEVSRLFERGTRSALLLLSPANRTALRAYEKVGFQRHRVVDALEKGL